MFLDFKLQRVLIFPCYSTHIIKGLFILRQLGICNRLLSAITTIICLDLDFSASSIVKLFFFLLFSLI